MTNYISYNKEAGAYVVSQDNAGDVLFVTGTSNAKYKQLTVTVHIGDGSAERPYYLFNKISLKNAIN